MNDLRQAAQRLIDRIDREGASPLDWREYDALCTALEQQQAEPDRRDLQAAGTHPAPCARHCEAKAFEIEIRGLKSQLKQQAEPVAVVDEVIHAAWAAGFVEGEKAALEQQAEPVGWLDGNDKLADFMHRDLKAEHDKRGSATLKDFTIPVYTAPPQRKPLTDEEIDQLLPEIVSGGSFTVITYGRAVARAIEAAHCIQEPKP